MNLPMQCLPAMAVFALAATALAAPQAVVRAPQGVNTPDPATTPDGARRARFIDGALDLGSVIRQASPVVRAGDELLGRGAQYLARFDARGLTYMAPSASAAVDASVRFRLVSWGRERGRSRGAGESRRSHDGRIVRFAHEGVVEEYEIRTEGVKQSFVFHERPRGTGDLVVRCRVDTGLPVVRSAKNQVLFEVGGVAGVRIGAVTGVGADGETVAGSLRWTQGALEMSLPRSFVDRAALPLVLDPLIGTSVTLSPATTVATDRTDVAYNPESDLYLVVWDANVPSIPGYPYYSPPFLEAQLVRGDGTLQGSTITIGGFYGRYALPRVASVRSTRGFVLAFWWGFYGNRIHWTTIDENGVPGNRMGVLTAGGPLIPSRPFGLGGEATSADDGAVLVHDYAGIHAVKLDPSTPANQRDVVISATGASPDIAATGGATGHHLVVWESTSQDVWGAVIDRDLGVLAAPFQITADALPDTDPQVDGDGTSWVVTFERGAVGSREIYCRGVSFDAASGTAYLTTREVPVATGTRDHARPSVAWMGESYLIGYQRQFSGRNWYAYIKSLQSFDCRRCEATIRLPRSNAYEGDVRIASMRSAGGAGSEALVIWRREPVSQPLGNGKALVQRVQALDGETTTLGGGCGAGGTAEATCAIVGARALGVGVRHAAPNSPAWMLVGLSPASFPCGPCGLVTSPLAAVALATDARGNATLRAPLSPDPSQLGVKLFVQWLVATTPGTSAPCAPGLAFSNGLQIEIQ